MAELTPPAPVTLREFDEIFEKVRNWGRWGPDDQLGTPQLHHRGHGAGRGRAGPLRTSRDDGDPDEHRRRAGQPEARSSTTWSRAMTSTSARAR